METTDASPGQRICDEPDAAPPPLALAPELPVLDVLPAEVPLPAAGPVALAVAAPTGLMVLCPMLLPTMVLLVALLLGVVSWGFVPVPIEGVLADELALLPA
jgi:hypothetical protein